MSGELDYTHLGQGKRSEEGISAACRKGKHSVCYKLKCTCKCHIEKGEVLMSANKINEVHADRQAPKDIPTPLKKQEPTAPIWQQGGVKSPEEALQRDKGSVRAPVPPGK